MNNIFEQASRLKLRFYSPKGLLSVEDLWDLPLTGSGANLDNVARGLHRQLKNDDDVSFVLKERKSDETIQLKFDLVKHIIDVRLTENAAAAAVQANKERKQKLLAILEQKEDQSLQTLSADELRKMINEL